jgi:hypothetical protein
VRVNPSRRHILVPQQFLRRANDYELLYHAAENQSRMLSGLKNSLEMR